MKPAKEEVLLAILKSTPNTYEALEKAYNAGQTSRDKEMIEIVENIKTPSHSSTGYRGIVANIQNQIINRIMSNSGGQDMCPICRQNKENAEKGIYGCKMCPEHGPTSVKTLTEEETYEANMAFNKDIKEYTDNTKEPDCILGTNSRD